MEVFADSRVSALVGAWVAVTGAVLGSFLNVVIARVPQGRSIVHPRSACPRCGTPIAWYDNIPVLSWLLLRARCRSCRSPISPRYPLVEALVAGAALLAWWRHGLGPAALAELVLVGFLLALAFIDLDTWLLPHALTWPLIGLGLLASAAGASAAPTLARSALGAAVGFGVFGLIWLVAERLLHREAMGLGDAFLLAGIGAWLGVAALLPVVLLASVQGSVVGLALLALGRSQPGPAAGGKPPAKGGKDEAEWIPPRHAVPFGPFLALGTLEWLYLSGALIRAIPALEVFR